MFLEPIFKLTDKKLENLYTIGGRKLFAVLNARGGFSAPLIRYGPIIDFGGIWTPEFRITGPIFFGVELDNKLVRLDDLASEALYHYWGLEILHSENELKIVQKVFPAFNEKSLFLSFSLKGRKELVFHIIGETWLAPSLAYGILPNKLKFMIHERGFAFSDKISTVSMVFNKKADIEIKKGISHIPKQLLPKFPSNSERTYWFHVKIGVNPNENILIVVNIAKGNLKKVIKKSQALLDRHDFFFKERKKAYENALAKAPQIVVPDENLNRAYISALIGLEMLKAEFQDGAKGILAGLPWFCAFWGRDTGWILPALISINDYDFVEEVINTFFSYQAKYDIKPLSARKGEIPHTINPISFPVYGSADATLFFPIIVEMLIKATGKVEYAKKWWKNILQIFEWGINRDEDGDGFLETKASKTWMTDDTWMDTEDRSRKPVDVQALWIRALRAIATIAELVGDNEVSNDALALYDRLSGLFHTMFWNGKDYYYDTIRPDGNPDNKVRPNALVPLIFNLASEEYANRILERIFMSDMLTDWGIRTLSEKDKEYNPLLYHSGMVWGLTTGWGALAAFNYRNSILGNKLLRIQINRIIEEGGMYSECYRGDKPIRYHSTILQAWSMSTFIWAVIEGLFGIRKDAIENTLIVMPNFPKDWSEALLKNVRVGNALIDLNFNISNKRVKIINKSDSEVIVRTGIDEKKVKAHSSITLEL